METTRGEAAAVVGIGASAGGLDACARLLSALPADTGMAFVVVMHLDPTRESHIADLLSRSTSLEVHQVGGPTRARENSVYVIAPAASLHIRDGILIPGEPRESRYKRKPVDDFFSSLAAWAGEGATGIVLSGTGENGSQGLRDIKAAGGLCLVHDPEDAEYDGMPRNAIATGVADAVLAPEALPEALLAARRRARQGLAFTAEPEAEQSPEGLSAVLAFLGERHGIDFGHYKAGTLRRRTERRMALLQTEDWWDYLDYLRQSPEEVASLYRDLLIGVTRFFRDPEAWQDLQERVIPEILSRHEDGDPIRVWVAGCATGEETYGLVILFFEAFERLRRSPQLQVYATDVSHEALAVARQGCYPPTIAGDLDPERLRRYFERRGERYCVASRLRDVVTFAPHDLLADPPFSRMDLVSCRNVLIYLRATAQDEVLEGFHFALRAGGTLWLGSSEGVGQQSHLFEPLSAAHRIYRASGATRPDRDRLPRWLAQHSPVAEATPARAPTQRDEPKLSRLLEHHVLDHYAPSSVAVNRNLDILHFFGPTDAYLRQPRGQARFDLLSWVRPGIYTKLRIGLREAAETKELVTVEGMRVEEDGFTRLVDCTIDPIAGIPGAEGVLLVSFRESPKPSSLRPPVAEEQASTEALVRHLEEELHQTRRELKGAVEELDGVNEEYRASHEELISLNEELQSSNEELETSKEELQSLNEELLTINRQLEGKNAELQELNADLKNLLASTGVPTVFLDRNLSIRRYTPEASEVMRIGPADIGRPIADIPLLVGDEGMLAAARRVLENLAPSEAEVATQDERWFVRSITPYRTEDDRIDGVCITFREITSQVRAARQSEGARAYAEAIVHASRTSLLVLDETLRIQSANLAFYETFTVSEAETIGQKLFELGNYQWDIAKLRALLDGLFAEGGEVRDYDVEHSFETIGWRFMRLNATLMNRGERPSLVLLSLEDLTDLRRAEVAALQRADQLVEEHQRKDEFIAMLGHELRNPLAAIANGLDLLRMKATPDPERGEEIVGMMSRQTRRITGMLDQLLELARALSGKIEIADYVVDLSEVASAALEAVAPIMEREGHELIVSLPETPAYVRGDSMRLTQVVENLLTNAGKYTESGGTVWLTVDRAEGGARISVRDTGIGVSPEVLPRIFELFSQDPRGRLRAQGGLGVGLPLVKHLVELHGGTVRAHSEGPEQGTEMVTTLPLAERPPSEVKGCGAGAEIEIPFQRILVVEDESDAAEALRGVLEATGCVVRCVETGAEALEQAKSFRPDLVFLDLVLPDAEGYDVARSLRAEHEDGLFIAAVTGLPRDDARLGDAGFDAHFLKPLDLEALPASLAALTATRAY